MNKSQNSLRRGPRLPILENSSAHPYDLTIGVDGKAESCGAPYPARESWDGWGYEYKSKLTLAGLPLLHISFKFRPNRTPVVARGVIAIGQFGCGVVCIPPFGLGVFSIAQFTVAGFALAQFAVAYSLVAQIGVYVAEEHGQLVVSLSHLLGIR